MVRCLQRRNDHLSKFGHVTLLASSLVYVAQVYTASSQQPEAPPCTTFTIRSLLDQRASVFDHDEFDMFHQVEHGSGVDLSQVHIGKSYKTSWSFLLLTSSSFYFSFDKGTSYAKSILSDCSHVSLNEEKTDEEQWYLGLEYVSEYDD